MTPEGSLADMPTDVGREKKDQAPKKELLGTSSETMYMDIPDTRVKTVLESPKREAPRVIQRTKEASREEAIASIQHFFAAVDRRNASITTGSQLASTEVRERDVVEVLDVPTTATTPLVSLDVEPRGMSCPRISLPEGSPSHPTVTATCRPRTWMQQLTEGQITESRREDVSSSESNTSTIETLPEDIPDELGHEWRVLHPFGLPGVRFPTDTTPLNQRRLAENDALVELIQTTEYVPTWGQRDYRLYPLDMVILFTEEEIEEEVEEDENGFRKDRWIDLMEDLEEDIPRVMERKHNTLQQTDHNQIGKKKIGLCLPTKREGKMKQRGVRYHNLLLLMFPLTWRLGYLQIRVV